MSQLRAASDRQRRGRGLCRSLVPVLACVGSVMLGSGAFAATTVYRSVDANGNVVFTDRPPRAGEATETVEIRAPNSISRPEESAPPAAGTEAWEWDMQAGEDADQTPFSYVALAIVAPANDEGIRQNDGNVTVIASVEPGLREGDQIQVLLDGQYIAAAAGTSITLTEVERGTHTLEAQVVDESGAVLLTSQPVTFHLLRYVPQLAPNRPRPVPHGG